MSSGGRWALRVAPRNYRPWWGQRRARALAQLEIPGLTLMGVAARQVGKSRFGTELVVGDGLRQPRGKSCVLVPTYRMGLVQSARLEELGALVGGEWKGQKGVLILPNRHEVWLRSTDNPDATRGLDLTGWLWLDEATLISEPAYLYALGCMLAGAHAKTLITTTPRGKNSWVYKTWKDREDQSIRRFMFRSGDSPYVSAIQLERMRRRMGGALSLQELEAVFVDDSSTPFPVELVDRMLTLEALSRRGDLLALGIDVAKEKHYVVATLMNEWGEAWTLGRWRHLAWPDTWNRLQEIAEQTGSTCFLDESGGAGSATADELELRLGKALVVRVRTGSGTVKQQLIEELQADAQHGRVRVDGTTPFAKDVRHELLFLTQTRTVSKGVERISYDPPSEDDHNDTVISLALANYGRRFLEANTTDGSGYDGFIEQSDPRRGPIAPTSDRPRSLPSRPQGDAGDFSWWPGSR